MNRRTLLISCVTAVAALAAAGIGAVAVSPSARAAAPYVYDVSWPQCPGPGSQPMPSPSNTSFVIIGLTRGLAFTENPCVDDQRQWSIDNAKPAHAYTMATYPTAAQITQYGTSGGPWTGSTDAGKLRNVGYAEAKYATATLTRIGWKPSTVWIDVEPRSSQAWPAATTRAAMQRNRFVVEGLMRGLEESGYAIGIYSNAGLWNTVVGPWWLPGVPAWVATGQHGEATAVAACSATSFSGGKTFLTQWTDGTYDFNAKCAAWTANPAKAPAPSVANDVNGDWKNDLLARQASSSQLWLYKGNGAKTGNVFQTRVAAGTFSKTSYNLVETAGDLTGDGKVDLLVRSTGGTLWLYPGTGGTTWGTRRSLGTGWGGMTAITGIGDFTGDGKPDLVALQKSNGVLYLYPGNGSGGLRARTALKSGWSGMDRVVGVGDVTLNGIPDLVVRQASTGTLYLYPGYANGALGTRVTIGTGWNSMWLFAGVGDLTGDGVPDLVTRAKSTSGGGLWLYPGLTTGKLGPRRSIGTGWQVMNQIA